MASLSLPHICMLHLTPPELVEVAAEAGFQNAGVRLQPALPGEERFPMIGDTPMMRETLSRLADTGLGVLDIEVFRLQSGTSFAPFRPVFEAAARLGARHLLTTGDIADETVAIDLFGSACDVAAEFGLTVDLEFLPMLAVNSLAMAERIVAGAGRENGAIMIDTLHVHRGGETVDALRTADRRFIRYLQVCDATAPPPDHETMFHQARYDRRMPGEGIIPNADYLAALPAGLPISVEVPNSRLLAELGPLAFAKLARRTTLDLLNGMATRAES